MATPRLSRKNRAQSLFPLRGEPREQCSYVYRVRGSGVYPGCVGVGYTQGGYIPRYTPGIYHIPAPPPFSLHRFPSPCTASLLLLPALKTSSRH